jgi:hypothetical protein
MIKKIIKKLRWLICKRLIYEREGRPREFEGCFFIKILEKEKVVDEFWTEYMTIKGDDTIELKKIIPEKNNGQKI